jgi:hypothetical protein
MTQEDTDLLSAKNWGVHSLRVAKGRPFTQINLYYSGVWSVRLRLLASCPPLLCSLAWCTPANNFLGEQRQLHAGGTAKGRSGQPEVTALYAALRQPSVNSAAMWSANTPSQCIRTPKRASCSPPRHPLW